MQQWGIKQTDGRDFKFVKVTSAIDKYIATNIWQRYISIYSAKS